MLIVASHSRTAAPSPFKQAYHRAFSAVNTFQFCPLPSDVRTPFLTPENKPFRDGTLGPHTTLNISPWHC
uniref:Uncharacterized protein n=1 Tax=Anguilla anguilla TaxID=7936 RepID=A0A0E9XWQ5_ANGAN